MSPAPTSLEQLLAKLDEATLTLLPTAESARSLRRAFDDAQRALSLHAWQPANILSWQQLLDRLWSDAIVTGIEPRLLLNATQEHALWRDTLSTDTLASPDALATLCAEAWSLANAYNAVARLRATSTTHDSRTFATWAEAFVRDCQRNQYLTRAALESALAEHITMRALPIPATLTLIGFNNLTPVQQSLLEALRNAGTTITELPFPSASSDEASGQNAVAEAANKNAAAASPNKNAVISTEAKRSGETPVFSAASPTTTANLYEAPTPQDELRAIAHYLRTYLESNDHPETRIAVLLPDATEDLASTFRDILAPELQSITADTDSAPWQFATLGPLATQPILATALDLAHLAHAPLDTPRVSALVLSPYLESEAGFRETAARFDAESLRRRPSLRPEITLTALHQLAQKSDHAPTWIKPFHHFLTTTNLDTPRTYAAWAELLRALLHAANWPALPRPLTSLEYQATEAWDALLDQLSTLDFRGKRTSYADFLSILTRQATTTPFTPASTNAPIQIFTPATAIAQHFDVLIFARATDANYPTAERTHPLLGFALQSQLHMPGANPLEAAARARQTFAQLLTAAPNILITFAKETPEGEQHIAPLLASLAHLESVNLTLPDTTETTPTITLPDDTSLPTHDSTGGTSLLKHQAACPFQAFATHRLQSNDLATQTTGYDAIESGNFLHNALSIFWSRVETQQNLRNTPTEKRAKFIASAVDQAVNPKFLLESSWDASYLDLQKERLRRVLNDWLDEELQRSPFTVLDSEKDVLLDLGPLTLKLRIDRIDAIEGGHVFVDYKTGASAKTKLWEGPRPDEPQLPLYALLSDPDELKALTFARVRSGDDMGWQGYQAETGILPLKKQATIDFHYQTEQWHRTLTALAEDFAAGVATVDPKDYPKTCSTCSQRLLCRLNPETLQPQLDEEEETGDESE